MRPGLQGLGDHPSTRKAVEVSYNPITAAIDEADHYLNNRRRTEAWSVISRMRDTLVRIGRFHAPVDTPDAITRVTLYLNEMDRIDAIRPQYSDEIHGVNDFILMRSDLRALLAYIASEQGEDGQ